LDGGLKGLESGKHSFWEPVTQTFPGERDLVEAGLGVPEHGFELGGMTRLVEGEQSFGTVGVELEQRAKQALGDLVRSEFETVQGTEESQ